MNVTSAVIYCFKLNASVNLKDFAIGFVLISVLLMGLLFYFIREAR